MPRTGLRRPAPNIDIPPVPSLDKDEVEEVPEEEDVPLTAAFVRVEGTHQLGPYPRTSILPAQHFEQLQRLIDSGALVYDFEATEIYIANVGIVPTDSVPPAVVQEVIRPHALWAAGPPVEVLGHMAMVRDQIDMTYTQGSPQGTPVQQVDRHIPNTTLNPPAAINDINHAVTDGLTFERN